MSLMWVGYLFSQELRTISYPKNFHHVDEDRGWDEVR